MITHNIILIGAGGHAKVLLDVVQPAAYVDPKPNEWLNGKGIKHMSEEELNALLPQKPLLMMGFVGLSCDALARRQALMMDYIKRGAQFPAIIHPAASASPWAIIHDGVQILPGAIVNAHATLREGAIINSGAIVEHDAIVGKGAHIAPRATVLGGASVGEGAFIGSGAVIVQGALVPSGYFVKALTVHR